MSRTCTSGLRESSGRGRYRDLDKGDSLALLLYGALLSVCWWTISKKPVDATLLSLWVTGIPVSLSGDGGDKISTIEPLASFGDEASIAGVNRVGAELPVCLVDD